MRHLLLISVDGKGRKAVVTHVLCQCVGILLCLCEDNDLRTRLIHNLVENLLQSSRLVEVLHHLDVLNDSLDSFEGLRPDLGPNNLVLQRRSKVMSPRQFATHEGYTSQTDRRLRNVADERV